MQLRLSAVGALGACLLLPFSARAQTAPLTPLPADSPPAATTPATDAAPTDDPATHPGVVVLRTPNVVVIEMPPAAPAVAEPSSAATAQISAPPEKPAQQDHWYGGQTLLLDGAATAMMLGGAATAKTDAGGVLAVSGALTYLFAAPIVHFSHGRIGPGFGSFALRFALPLETAFDGLLIGAALSKQDRYGESNDEGAAAGAVVGLFGGMVGAMVIDSALLAHEKVDEKDPEAFDPSTDATAKSPRKEGKSRSPLQVDWAPNASPVTGGATVGVSGRF